MQRLGQGLGKLRDEPVFEQGPACLRGRTLHSSGAGRERQARVPLMWFPTQKIQKQSTSLELREEFGKVNIADPGRLLRKGRAGEEERELVLTGASCP